MSPDDLDTVVDVAIGDLPLEVQANLEDVEIVVVASHLDARCSEHTAGDPNFQGLFVGHPMKETAADAAADDPSRQLPPPEGTIYLNAATIENQDEALHVLHHELGHALGLSEREVDELGLTVTDEDGQASLDEDEDDEDEDDEDDEDEDEEGEQP